MIVRTRRPRLYSRRTKIVCTIGPATSSAGIIEKLIRSGMNVARLNLSHGTLMEHNQNIESIRNISQRLCITVAVLIDLPGPKYRTGKLKQGRAMLKRGAELVLTTIATEGDAALVPVNFPNLPRDVKPGDTILLDDGAIQLRVQQINESEVKCRVVVGGMLTEERGLVVPGMHISVPFVTETLRKDLLFAIEQQPDYIALSFVTAAEQVTAVRNLIQEKTADIPVIAKIERGEAVKNFDGILAVSDGIMVARGDLGVEIPLERVPLVQKEAIKKCNRAGKPVITATEMLKSMVKAVRPTRAEVTDVANAIFDGTDALMLSEETSIGQYPLQAVKMMDRIARETEKNLPYELALSEKIGWLEPKTEELISYNACLTARNLEARAIVAVTQSGSTAARVSKYRPNTPILAMAASEGVCRRIVLHWGINPVCIASPPSMPELFTRASALSRRLGLAKPGDLIVVTGGLPMGVSGTTNLLKVETVS